MMMREKFDQLLYILILALGFLSLLLLPFQQGYAMKALRAAGELGLLAIFISPKKYLNGNTKYISACLFILALLSFLWFRTYRSPDSLYFGAYINYRDWSLAGLFAAFAFPVLSSNRKNSASIINIHLLIALLVNILYVAYSFYQIAILKEPRVTLSLAYGPNSTGAAYTISFIATYTLITISWTVKKFKIPLILIFAFANIVAISLTGTRAAIIAFPIVLLFIFWHEIKQRDKKTKLNSILLLIFLSILSAVFLAKPVAKRIIEMKSDLTQYENRNSATSIGARFAMYQVGIDSSIDNYAWQSLEKRNQKILSIIQDNPDWSGAKPYLGVHLHNQFIDTLSTIGWIGVILDILFLASILHFSLNNKCLLISAYAILFLLFGLSDTLTYATPVPLAWLLTLMLTCSVRNNKKINDN
ncbi:O-antigen ligase [Cedecea davisae]|uniref:O-antigen polymerase n=1 Tax=Cedecea davisae DSM 4568 TaxID=566551 RepID=S3IHY3_9ENTR|nr:O-antigen ligase family protein [Cedecea davisae]EPF12625.1 O-antigen polymerase [Cedecea davisae DSM 4568]SUX37034.1 O-antigen ligase [Cedecea davisae]